MHDKHDKAHGAEKVVNGANFQFKKNPAVLYQLRPFSLQLQRELIQSYNQCVSVTVNTKKGKMVIGVKMTQRKFNKTQICHSLYFTSI